ncbi:MFS transporter [Methylobacterium oryzisoli]|uniref:MFS transporter n=1 Tax=Methylobacterium oryzisoli TaxID=3385502 RepID=UPI00389138E9
MAMITHVRVVRGRGGVTLAVAAAALVLSGAMGIRQTFGLFLGPFSVEHGIPVATTALAIALHNLVWGLAQPVAGATADRYGVAPVIAFGALVFAGGLALAALLPSGPMLLVGMGLMVGIGISCTSFGVVLPAIGRMASPESRSSALGLASAGGSLGQVLLVPFAESITALAGMTAALLALAGIILAVAPLGYRLDRGGPVSAGADESTPGSLRDVVALAGRTPGYQLLTLGFFSCGFQLAFIATHLPGYLTLCHMPMGLGATALALIGLFNMIGSWGCGWLGGRFRQQHVLGWLYVVRAVAIGAFALAPKSEMVVILFAAVMGLTWLGTVPLTSGLVAKVFGVRHLGTLFGIVFLSHQIGSFLGAWLGGVVLDATGSYGPVWAATAIAGLIAALLHFPIDDRPGRIAQPVAARA